MPPLTCERRTSKQEVPHDGPTGDPLWPDLEDMFIQLFGCPVRPLFVASCPFASHRLLTLIYITRLYCLSAQLLLLMTRLLSPICVKEQRC